MLREGYTSHAHTPTVTHHIHKYKYITNLAEHVFYVKVSIVTLTFLLLCEQLQGRFEQLKQLHAEERGALEEKRRVLEEEQSSFSKRRAAAQLLQAKNLNANGKKDKDRKK